MYARSDGRQKKTIPTRRGKTNSSEHHKMSWPLYDDHYNEARNEPKQVGSHCLRTVKFFLMEIIFYAFVAVCMLTLNFQNHILKKTISGTNALDPDQDQ